MSFVLLLWLTICVVTSAKVTNDDRISKESVIWEQYMGPVNMMHTFMHLGHDSISRVPIFQQCQNEREQAIQEYSSESRINVAHHMCLSKWPYYLRLGTPIWNTLVQPVDSASPALSTWCGVPCVSWLFHRLSELQLNTTLSTTELDTHHSMLLGYTASCRAHLCNTQLHWGGACWHEDVIEKMQKHRYDIGNFICEFNRMGPRSGVGDFLFCPAL